MSENKEQEKQPDPEKLEVLRSLPAEITNSFTKEEVKAFLFEKDWPDSLRDKLKDYIVDE
ncbi:MAG: hypothetical protein JRJ60_07440 [Deltaproteobacteria bacterium]|nr:hypothetical protein [Deltaproteobacteria bacterium]